MSLKASPKSIFLLLSTATSLLLIVSLHRVWSEALPEAPARYESKGFVQGNMEILSSRLKGLKKERNDISPTVDSSKKTSKNSKTTNQKRAASERGRLSPKTGMEWFKKGLDATAKKNYKESIKSYDMAIVFFPGNQNIHYNRAIVYCHDGQYGMAIKDFSKAIEINPVDADALYNRGISHHLDGQLDKAIDDYSRAIKLTPHDADVYWNRGIAYSDKKRDDLAASDYCTAIDINPAISKETADKAKK